MNEIAYEEGRRSAWRRILAECLGQLGYPEGEKRIAQLVKEREETRSCTTGSMLRLW